MLERPFGWGRVALLLALLPACGGPTGSADAGAGGSTAEGTGGEPGDGSGGASGGSASGGAEGLGGGTSTGGEVACPVDGDGKTTLVFVNGCSGTLDYAGSDLPGGTLAPGELTCVDIGTDVEELSAKRYWGWMGEDPGGEHHSLAEFTFNTDFYDFDWYNISFVDAFNLPLQIVPVARPDCDALACAEDLLPNCPSAGLFQDSSGAVTSCVSPDRDDPASEVALYFEQCDDAYAWSGDDQQGTDPSPVKACAGEDWEIVFCPEQ